MCQLAPNDNGILEATAEQIAILRELGVSDLELQGISSEDAEIMIDAIRAMKADGKY